jgi:hypothetical protein
MKIKGKKKIQFKCIFLEFKSKGHGIIECHFSDLVCAIKILVVSSGSLIFKLLLF